MAYGSGLGFTVRMIPTTWTPHRRSSDDELVGYLRTDGDGVTPLCLTGFPLGEESDRDRAIRVLEADGLSVLAEAWSLDHDGEIIEVRILTARPDAVVVVEAPYGYPQPDGRRFELNVPVTGLRPGRHR